MDANNDELLPNRTDIYDENPYFVAHNFQNNTVRNRLTGGLTLRYQILDWLYAQAQVTRDGYTFDLRQVTPNGVQYTNNGGGSINLSSTNQHELDGNGMLGISKTFGNFSVNAAGWCVLSIEQVHESAGRRRAIHNSVCLHHQ